MSGPAKVLWLVIDTEEDANCNMLTWCLTRREAREAADRANRLVGYAPTCVVVRYEATLAKGVTR